MLRAVRNDISYTMKVKEILKRNKTIHSLYTKMYPYMHGVVLYVHYSFALMYMKKNKKRVMTKINNGEVLNVAFIIQYIPGWNKLEPIYSKMVESDRFNPVIVCVPLNIQKNQLLDNNGNDTYEYFTEHGYKVINALRDDGSWYDLHQLEPDYLFHSRPYNNFMPKCYTSPKIVKYALICNVLYGAKLTTGVTDTVFNKEYFGDVFIYFAFDHYEIKEYEEKLKRGVRSGTQKCFQFGAMGLEQILAAKHEKSKSEFKKTLIWTPRWSTDANVGGSNFFNYKDTVFELARTRKDVLFIIRPHPLMLDNFVKTGEMSKEELVDFKDYCYNESNIILDSAKEYADEFWESDFLITDASGILPEYFVTGKPIIYCHSKANFEYVQYAKSIIQTCYETFSKEDLKKYFSKLTADDDTKEKERTACINEYFGNVANNSGNILKALISIDKVN